MTEETSDRLVNLSADALEHLSEWLQATEAFVAEQAPLVAQEIIRWGIWKAALLISLGVFFLGLVVIATFVGRRWCKGNDCEGIDRAGTTIVGSILGLGVFAACFAPGIYLLCYVLTAPRLYILDQLSKLM